MHHRDPTPRRNSRLRHALHRVAKPGTRQLDAAVSIGRNQTPRSGATTNVSRIVPVGVKSVRSNNSAAARKTTQYLAWLFDGSLTFYLVFSMDHDLIFSTVDPLSYLPISPSNNRMPARFPGTTGDVGVGTAEFATGNSGGK